MVAVAEVPELVQMEALFLLVLQSPVAQEHLSIFLVLQLPMASVVQVVPDSPAPTVRLTEQRLALAGPATGGGAAVAEAVGGIGFLGQVLEGLEAKNLRGLIDDAKKSLGSGVVVFVAVNDGRASVAVGVTDDLVGTRSAVDLVRLASAAVGGQGGGGRPDFAQAGGPDGAQAVAAVAAVRAALAG